MGFDEGFFKKNMGWGGRPLMGKPCPLLPPFPPFKKTCPCTILLPPFFNFSDFPLLGRYLKFTPPFLKGGMGVQTMAPKYKILLIRQINDYKVNLKQLVQAVFSILGCYIHEIETSIDK